MSGERGENGGGSSASQIPDQQTTQSQFVSSENLGGGDWLSLHKIKYVDPTGRTRFWEGVERKTRPKNGGVDGVVIMAVIKKMFHFDNVVLVKQYRPPMKAYTLEFPAGLVDEGETIEQAAVREMKEETGFKINVKHWSPATCLDPGTENCTVVLASAEIDGDDAENKNTNAVVRPGEGEFIDIIQIPVNDMLSKLNEYSKSGVVVDARVYSYAIALTQATKEKRVEPAQK